VTKLNILSSVDITLDDKLYMSIEINSNLSSPFSYYDTLTNITNGVHNFTIKTNCEGWNLEMHGLWANKLTYENSSDLMTFIVDEPTQSPEPHQPEPFPTVPIAAVSGAAAVVVVGAGLFVYFKKRKH